MVAIRILSGEDPHKKCFGHSLKKSSKLVIIFLVIDDRVRMSLLVRIVSVDITCFVLATNLNETVPYRASTVVSLSYSQRPFHAIRSPDSFSSWKDKFVVAGSFDPSLTHVFLQ